MITKGVLRTTVDGVYGFRCPGCRSVHYLDSKWSFDGNYDKPTFAPSIKLTSGHYVSSFKQGDDCWCTYNAKHPDNPSSFKCFLCHSFVRAGNIEFLSDSTHELAGKTVPLEPEAEDAT